MPKLDLVQRNAVLLPDCDRHCRLGIFAAVSVSHYVRAGLLSRTVVTASLVAVAYCLMIIAVSAGAAVAVAMVLGLPSAPLYGAMMSLQARRGRIAAAAD